MNGKRIPDINLVFCLVHLPMEFLVMYDMYNLYNDMKLLVMYNLYNDMKLLVMYKL